MRMFVPFCAQVLLFAQTASAIPWPEDKCEALQALDVDMTVPTRQEENEKQLYLRTKILPLPEFKTVNENYEGTLNGWWWSELLRDQTRNICFGFRVEVDKDQHGFDGPGFGSEPTKQAQGRAYRNCRTDYPDAKHKSWRMYFSITQHQGEWVDVEEEEQDMIVKDVECQKVKSDGTEETVKTDKRLCWDFGVDDKAGKEEPRTQFRPIYNLKDKDNTNEDQFFDKDDETKNPYGTLSEENKTNTEFVKLAKNKKSFAELWQDLNKDKYRCSDTPYTYKVLRKETVQEEFEKKQVDTVYNRSIYFKDKT